MSGHKLPASLARASDFHQFMSEPLEFLARARSIHGNLFVIKDSGPVFSRSSDCSGVIAAFGAEHQRTVLSDIESYGMPVSAAQHLRLPKNLINLNRSLHSLTAAQHAIQKRYLMDVLNKRSIEAVHGVAWRAIENVAKGWGVGRTVGLLHQMRELMLQVSCSMLFGDQYADNSRLSILLQTYFWLRREVSSPTNSPEKESLEKLVEIGDSLYIALRRYVRECRHSSRTSCGGMLAKLATLQRPTERPLSEDAIVGHSNILFVSSTEPIAVALTWILLILSQLPALRDGLRNELSSVLGVSSLPTAGQLEQLRLLDQVIKESLRLLPPNAFMVRITTRETSLGETHLPPRCEVVLCPLLSHRDGESFQRPNDFLPSRWTDSSPSPFVYFPFGAGGHACVGANLATHLIKATLAILLPRFDVILAGDQHIDWRVHIVFMPICDPAVFIGGVGVSTGIRAGRIDGPVAKLLNLEIS